jgi:peptide chain release factor 2
MRDDLDVALEMAEAGDDETLNEAQSILADVHKELAALEVQSLLGGELDGNDAFVTINSGAGGTESCDWANILFRMYLRFAERKGWTTEIQDILDGEEAGIKNVTFTVSGEFAFGLLKAESCLFSLVVISVL